MKKNTLLKKSRLGFLKGLVFGFCLLAGMANSNAQTRLYVKATGGNNTNTGKTWLNAVQNLDTALNRAKVADTILVAAGTYTGSFIMKEGVTVLGGFPANADGTTTLQDRKLPGTNQNLTVLDGNNSQRPLTQLKPFSTPTVWEGLVLKNGAATINNLGVGSIIYGNNNQPAGVLYQYNTTTKSGYMVSLQEVEKQWGGYGTNISGLPNITSSAIAQADSAGASNTALIVKQLGAGDYVAYWADTLTAGGFTQWYLPACGELYTLYQQKAAINKSLKHLQNDTLKTKWYWSSSENAANFAWYGGVVNYLSKSYIGLARAVRAFNSFSHLTNLAFCGGGALLQNNGILRLCVVENCTASAMGGGVYAHTGARIEGCLVQNNTAPSGSGTYLAGSQSVLTGSTVVNNTQTQQPQPAAKPQIGNYYYTDGSYAATAQTGKELVGVVCAIDPQNPYKGLLINRNENGADSTWQCHTSWAAGLRTGGASTWRLPTKEELQAIYKNKATLNAVAGFTQFSNTSYWSSSKYGEYFAWIVSFGSGSADFGNMDYGYRARAVLAFTLFENSTISGGGVAAGAGSQITNSIAFANKDVLAQVFNLSGEGTITYTAAEGTAPAGEGNQTVSENDFINAATKNFSLKETSALRAAGNTTSVPAGLTQDLAGFKRVIGGITDIGAFQTKATPVITWNTPADITYGKSLSVTQLNASANVAGTFVYTPASGILLNAGTHTLSVTFTPTDVTNYIPATKTVNITVTQAPQSITFNCSQLNNAKAGSGIILSATATSNLEVTFESSNPSVAKVEDNKLIFLSVGSATITARQAGNNNYRAADVVCTTAVNGIRYVSATGTATVEKAVGSFANACNNLQAVINIAHNGDSILVAAGIYTGSFSMKEGVTVLGGFPQNADANTTLQDRKLPGTGENLTILDGANSQRPLTQLKPFTTATVWEGFVLQNGNAPTGGGAYLLANGTLRNTIVRNNTVKTPAPGQYIPEQGGVVYRVQGTTAYVMAMEDCEEGSKDLFTTAAATSYINNCLGAATHFNGKAETDALITKGSAAANAACNYRDVAGHTDWYLPAVGDWRLFVTECQNAGSTTDLFDTVQKGITRNGGKGLTSYYWSSTTVEESTAWHVYFGVGYVSNDDVFSINRVRSVRAFQLFNYLGGGVYMGSGAGVEGCLVQNNTAPNGSGVYNGGGSLVNSTVVNNVADTSLLPPKPKYKVGDLYPFPNSQQGIVFYVDATGEHGWVVSLQESSASCQWLPSGSHIIPGITATTFATEATADTAGYANTLALRNYMVNNNITNKEDYAAYKTDFANGWYLPAAGQLRKLYAVLPEVNAALTTNGGTTLSTAYYWSSTQYNASDAWYVHFNNGDLGNYVYSNLRVKSVRAF